MARLWAVSCVLLLALARVACQQVDGSGDEEAECEEAWNYVEFMKKDLSGKVEEILTSLYNAKQRQSSNVIDDTLTNTMEGVMEIRESILTRIKGIRKGDDAIPICPEQNLIRQEKHLSDFRKEIMKILLKLVGQDSSSIDILKTISSELLRFKTLVGQEVMRMLMLPQHRTNLPLSTGDNTQCDVLKQLGFIMENLVACAEKEEVDKTDGDDDKTLNTLDEPQPGADCRAPNMYSMDLISATETIDSEIGNLYNRLITAIEEDERLEHFQKLDFFKQLREVVNDIITELVTEDDEEKLKKVVTRNVNRVISALKSKLKDCQVESGPGGCKSCAAEIIYDSVAKMNDFKDFFQKSDDNSQKMEFVRSDMIRFINDNDEKARDILIEQATSEIANDCDTQKLDVLKMLKAPMWMLVNTTIFSDIAEVEVMVGAMVEQLDNMLTKYCGSEEVAKSRGPEGPNCDWEEYEQTGKYLGKVDEIIQEALFKTPDDSDQMTALLGFVDIQQKLDKRVKNLFEEKLVCPDEVKILKQTYMTQVNRCMAEFMNRNLKFVLMSRSQRMSCTKNLRDSMEERMAKLLQREVEKSLNGFQG